MKKNVHSLESYRNTDTKPSMEELKKSLALALTACDIAEGCEDSVRREIEAQIEKIYQLTGDIVNQPAKLEKLTQELVTQQQTLLAYTELFAAGHFKDAQYLDRLLKQNEEKGQAVLDLAKTIMSDKVSLANIVGELSNERMNRNLKKLNFTNHDDELEHTLETSSALRM